MPQPTKGEKKECNCGQALHIRETYMHLEGCPLLNHPSPSSGMKWGKSFREKCKESYAKGGFLTTDMAVQDWRLDIDSMIYFISQAISEAYKRGKHDGFAEEGVNCDKHCEEARADERKKIEEERDEKEKEFLQGFAYKKPKIEEK